MGEELLSLRWNNHQSHFVDILTFLREQEVFIDVTLACGGKLYPAHKFVLSTCSDYFKQMFTKIPDKHPIVFMKDVLCKDLEALLDFMYHGEVNVPQSSLGSLIKTAEGLQIKGLAVPDDPPAPKSSAAKDRREPKARDNSYSPSPKRLRTRDKSPPPAPAVSNSNNVSQNNYTSRKSVDIPSSDPLSTDIADEDSRNSLVGDSISSVNNAKSHSNSSQLSANSRVNSPSETTNHAASGANSSPGPSGLQPSKEEQVDIKQEDEVVELDDQGDWVGGLESDGRESGLVDGMMGVDAAPNFSDLLANPSDSALNTSSPGDPAMKMLLDGVPYRQVARYLCGTDTVCPICLKEFPSSHSMIRHCQFHVRGIPRMKCRSCGQPFHTKDQLSDHEARCDALPPIAHPSLPPMPPLVP